MSGASFYLWGGPHPAELLMRSRESGGYGLGDDAMATRMLCVRDPLYLATNVLGKTLLGNPSPNHRRVADLILAQKSFIYLDHRGSFKTTLVDEVGTIHEWLRFPDYRQLFLQASLDLGKKLSGQVRHHLRETQAFRAFFPEYAIDTTDEAGQIMSFNVPCKRSNTREASLTIGTPDTSLSMTHYDVIRGSDVSNETNNPPPCGKGTIEEAIKIQQWVATTDGLLESKVVNPFAHKTFDGTRWSEVDLWGFLIENDKKNRLEKVISGVTTVDGRFVSTVPGFTHEILQEIRDQPTMSAAMWASNYMNSPIVGSGAMQFLAEWLKPYGQLPDTLDIAITVDPAWTEQDKNPEADRSAIVVSGVCPVGNLYVCAFQAGRWNPGDLFDILYQMIGSWNPTWVGIEGGTQSVSFIETATNMLQRDFPFIPIRVMPPKGQNKLVRVIPLHTHAQKKGIYVRPGEHDELIQELLRFPSGKYKDLVDALAYRAQDLQMPHLRGSLPEGPRFERNQLSGRDYVDLDKMLRGVREYDKPSWETISGGRN